MTCESQQNVGDVRIPKRRDELIERELPEELILYTPETDRAFLLNHTAAATWDLCDGQHTTSQIAEQISVHSGAPMQSVLEDVASTIRRFDSDHLLADHDHAA